MTVLQRGRAFLAPFRTARATVQRETTVDDGMGGTTTVWATVATNLPVAVLRMRRLSVLVTEGNSLLSRSLYTLNFDVDVNVRARDRITVNDQTYEVQAVIKNTTYGVATEAQCALEE